MSVLYNVLSSCLLLPLLPRLLLQEAVEQQHDLRPMHLAVLAWASARLQWTPPPQLLAAINAQARRQLVHFNAGSLALLLQGMRQLGALDKELLAEVAAGIAGEQEVALNAKDAACILAAFVAEPTAGQLRDVEGMADRIGAAIKQRTDKAAPPVVTDLLVCYSKLPYHHAVLLSLLWSATDRGEAFTLRQWVKLLQSASRLGYNKVAADAAVEAQLVPFYKAADQQLRRHLEGAALPAAAAAAAPVPGAAADASIGSVSAPGTAASAPAAVPALSPRARLPHDDGAGWWQKLGRLGRRRGKAGREQQQEASPAEEQQQRQQQEQRSLHPLQFDAAVDIGVSLAERSLLSDKAAGYLAEVGLKLLPQLKPRRLWLLLNVLTSREQLLQNEDVRALLVAAVGYLQDRDLPGTSPSLTVLVGITKPLARAVSLHVAQDSGEALLKSLYEEVMPVLEDCSYQQLMLLWDSARLSGVASGEFRDRVHAVAGQRGWLLSASGLSMG